MTLNAPGNRPPIYSSFLTVFFSSGLGPLRLAFDVRPLPLATKMWSPSAEIRTEVGYQPTGKKPSERLCPRLRNIEDGHIVGIGVGNPQRVAVGRQGEAVWACCRWAPWGIATC